MRRCAHPVGFREVWQLCRVDRIDGVHHGSVCGGSFLDLRSCDEPREIKLVRADLSATVDNRIARVVCVNNAVLASIYTLEKEDVEVAREERTRQGVTRNDIFPNAFLMPNILDMHSTLLPEPILSCYAF